MNLKTKKSNYFRKKVSYQIKHACILTRVTLNMSNKSLLCFT